MIIIIMISRASIYCTGWEQKAINNNTNNTHTHFSKSTTVPIIIMKSIFQCQAPLEASQSVLESYYKTNAHTSTVVALAPQGTEHSSKLN